MRTARSEPRRRRTKRCRDHTALLRAYNKAVAYFSFVLDALRAGSTAENPAEYQRLRGYVEQAYLVTRRRRVELEGHIQEHHCYPG